MCEQTVSAGPRWRAYMPIVSNSIKEQVANEAPRTNDLKINWTETTAFGHGETGQTFVNAERNYEAVREHIINSLIKVIFLKSIRANTFRRRKCEKKLPKISAGFRISRSLCGASRLTSKMVTEGRKTSGPEEAAVISINPLVEHIGLRACSWVLGPHLARATERRDWPILF